MRYLVISCAFLSILGGIANADLATGLMGYWPMNEGAGASVADVTAFGHDGTIITGASSPIWAAGLNGKCLNFDGTDDRVVIENQDFFNFYDQLTVAVWVKGSFVHMWQAFASKGGEASGWQIRRYSDSVNAGFTIRALSPIEDYQGAAVITDGQWHLVAATYDGSTLRIYVDGQIDLESAVAGTPNPSDEPIVFGAANFGDLALGNYHSGLLDEVAIWHRALAPQDVNDIYNGGVPQDLIHWRWNVTDPAPADNAVDVAFDVPVNLSWSLGSGSPEPVTQQVLFYGTNKLDVASSSVASPAGDTTTVTLGSTDTVYPINVVSDITYYWRVASVMGSNYNDPNIVAQGYTWSFTTAQTVPSFTRQPGFQFLTTGENASFTVEGLFVDSYQWYRSGISGDNALTDGTEYSGTTTDTLTVLDVDDSDAGYSYYCVITNSAGQAQSNDCGLRIKALLAHWPLNGSPDEATYSSLDGVITGDVTWVDSPPFGTVASFDTGEYITIPSDSNDASFDVYDALTVSCLVRNPGSIAWESFVSKNGENGEGWMLRQQDGSGTGVFTLRGTTGNDDPAGVAHIDDGQWHHVAGVYNFYAGKRYLYVDGKLDRELNESGLITATAQPVIIGRTPASWANYFSGEMAHVQIHNYPLTGTDVAELYYSLLGTPFCMETPEFDLSGDCQVNLDDLALISTNWLACGLYPNCN